MFSNAESISFRGKEVKKIVRINDNAILYQKENDDVRLILEIEEYLSRNETPGFKITFKTEDNEGNFVPFTTNNLKLYKNNEVLFSIPGGSFYEPTELRIEEENFFNIGDKIHISVPDQYLTSNIVTIRGDYMEYVEITFNGEVLTQEGGFVGTDMLVSYGDETEIQEFTGKLEHTYENNETHVIKIYKVTEFEQYCFRDCVGLTAIDIPSTVTKLGQQCFMRCTDLTTVNMSPGVTRIGVSCFRGCTSLTTVNISSTLTRYGGYCFEGCTSLTNIDIPSNIQSIDNHCFDDCTSLISLTIPKEVTSIDRNFIDGCTNLTEITLNWDTSSDILYYFSNWTSECPNFDHFIIPFGTKSLYVEKQYPSDKLIEANGPPASITLEKTDGKQILSYADRTTLPVMEFCRLAATVVDANNNPLSNVYVDFYKNDEVWMPDVPTDSNGQAIVTYDSEGVGDVEIYAKIGNLVTETYAIEDCNYYHTTEYSSESSLDISLPNKFKLEFDIKPTNRSTSSGGNNGYIRIGADANSGVWVGQMTSGGYHGIILKSSTTATYCPTITNLDWNHIIVTFDGATVNYTCNNETVTVSASNLPKINGLVTTTYEHLKNIKIKPLQSIDISVDNPILSYADNTQANPQTATLTATVNPIESGKTVQIYQDDVLIATEQTDSQGQVSYEYTSQGVGDVEFEFKCGLVTKTYTIYDWHRYDDCSTDKTSNYTKGSNASLSFDTDHYVMSTSTDDSVEVLDGVDNVQFEVLLKHNSNVGGIQIGQNPSSIHDGAVGLYNNASNTTYLALFPWSNIKSQNNVTNNSDYYRYILTINGSSVTARIENSNGTSLFSGTTSKSLSAKHFCIFNVGNNTLNIKEIVVKPL